MKKGTLKFELVQKVVFSLHQKATRTQSALIIKKRWKYNKKKKGQPICNLAIGNGCFCLVLGMGE